MSAAKTILAEIPDDMQKEVFEELKTKFDKSKEADERKEARSSITAFAKRKNDEALAKKQKQIKYIIQN